jgi:DNA-binding GntR family transcriptional regulator
LFESIEYPLDEIANVIWYTGMSENYTFERDRAYQRLLELVMAGALSPEQPLSERKLAQSLAVGRTPVREAIKRMTGEGLVEVRPARGTYIRQITRADVLEIYEVRYGVEGIAAYLAAERGVGRTPVREAIKRMTGEGLVEVRPARGTYIRQISRADVLEIYEVRFGVDGIAAYLAAERGPTDEFAHYRQTFLDMIKRPNAFGLAEIHRIGQDFHVEVFRAARNQYLLELYKPMRLRHQVAFGLPRMYDHQSVHASVHEHLEILDAVEKREPARARQSICDHLATGLAVRSRIIEQFEYKSNSARAAG